MVTRLTCRNFTAAMAASAFAGPAAAYVIVLSLVVDAGRAIRADLADVGFKRVEGAKGSKEWWSRV